MIDNDQEDVSAPSGTASASSNEMAEALQSIKSANPSLASEIDAANVTPESLAGSHDRATAGEHDSAKHATPE
jgi:hypothetical protein